MNKGWLLSVPTLAFRGHGLSLLVAALLRGLRLMLLPQESRASAPSNRLIKFLRSIQQFILYSIYNIEKGISPTSTWQPSLRFWTQTPIFVLASARSLPRGKRPPVTESNNIINKEPEVRLPVLFSPAIQYARRIIWI